MTRLHPHSRRRDWRAGGAALTLLAVALGGATVAGWGPSALFTPSAAQVDALTDPAGHADAARRDEIRQRFEQAVVMLHARRYDHAMTALHRVLELAPQLPEAHVNMGYALLGLERPAAARDFFEGAIALQARQANAYHGLALAHEALGDFELAIGAMRSYLHLARDEREEQLRRARAALWEWEARVQSQRAGGAASAPR